MKHTGAICPVCGNKTDQSPCEICGYEWEEDWEEIDKEE